MYLSRVRLNTEKRQTQLALAAPEKLHGAVERCFGTDCPRKRNLWRIDMLHDMCYLLILSEDRPELSHIREQFGYPGEPDEIKTFDSLLGRIENGSVWHFRLKANPTHTVKQAGEDRGRVVAHVSEKYEMEWLHRRAEQNGFAVLTEGSCVVGAGWKIFNKTGQRSRIRLKEVTFEGILRVEDRDLFCNALVNGIGRGKAYGMGMITVMRI